MYNSSDKLEQQQPENHKSSTDNLAKEPSNIADNEKAILLSECEKESFEKPKAAQEKPAATNRDEFKPSESSNNKKSALDSSSISKLSPRLVDLEKFLDSKFFQIIVNVMTVYALFADDFRSAFLPKSVDNGFDSVTIFCMVIFTLEIILGVLTKEKYFNSFFFWLDIISTISLIFDLKWFQNAVLTNPLQFFIYSGKPRTRVNWQELAEHRESEQEPVV